MEIRYRSEVSGGSQVRDIRNILLFEIYELGNIDSHDYICEHYLDGELKEQCQELIENIDNNDYTESFVIDLINRIILAVNYKTKHNIRYGLWLADREVVLDDYAYGNEEDIEAYYVSDVILSDLGRDGTLYGYESYLEPILE